MFDLCSIWLASYTEFRHFTCFWPLGKLTRINHQILDIPLHITVNLMDLHNIKGPQDYYKFYLTSSEGLVGLDGKGNLIPLSHMLGAHIKAIELTALWNLIQTINKVHKHNIPVHGHGPSNSPAIDTSLMTTPTSPIMEHHVEMGQPEGSSMVTVKELLEDPKIQLSMIQSAFSAFTSLFTPSKTTQFPRSDGPEVPHQVSVASTPTSSDSPDINKELNTYKDRLSIELNSFKKTTGNTE